MPILVGIFCGANVNIFVAMAMTDISSTMTHAYSKISGRFVLKLRVQIFDT